MLGFTDKPTLGGIQFMDPAPIQRIILFWEDSEAGKVAESIKRPSF